MQRLCLIIVLAVGASLAAGAFTTPDVPPRPDYQEFHYDDGGCEVGYVMYTGGQYWAVEFGEDLTGGTAGHIDQLGAYTVAGWPDSTFQGCYLHVFSEYGGYPDEDLCREYLAFQSGDQYEWIDVDVEISTGLFYVVFEQFGDYPACDSIGVDTDNSGHSWMDGQPFTEGELMLRCYWQSDNSAVEPSSWGRVKALYQ
ncbi:MAG: hypothetical protein GF399_04895 [Candidatus Coatesbacteria bacterium]|nr:hypothetical protein [Candidatus Coatesbacteria bacterium]